MNWDELSKRFHLKELLERIIDNWNFNLIDLKCRLDFESQKFVILAFEFIIKIEKWSIFFNHCIELSSFLIIKRR